MRKVYCCPSLDPPYLSSVGSQVPFCLGNTESPLGSWVLSSDCMLTGPVLNQTKTNPNPFEVKIALLIGLLKEQLAVY